MEYIKYLVLIAVLASCQSERKPDEKNPEGSSDTLIAKPKNIIFMVGDGMGIAQITAGMLANGNKLALEKVKTVGLIKTSSGDNLITDSAAGATAFSTGHKTYNNAIGVDMDTLALETIMETAQKRGMSTGFVVTSSVTHATPACFYAHEPSRYNMEAIALDLVKSSVDFFVGGGRKYFANRQDEMNLLDSLSLKGFKIAADLNHIATEDSKVGVFTADEEPLSLMRGREEYLPQAVDAAVQKLSKNNKGFFLLVEGSQIDWGGHAKDSDYIIDEMLEFNKAIERAYSFAEQDGNTLVIVTADHETGGYAIIGGTLDGKIIQGGFVVDHHTPEMVPVFAFGPGSESFSGIYENTAIYHKTMEALGFEKPAL